MATGRGELNKLCCIHTKKHDVTIKNNKGNLYLTHKEDKHGYHIEIDK